MFGMIKSKTSDRKGKKRKKLPDILAAVLLLVLLLGAADASRVRKYEDFLSKSRETAAISSISDDVMLLAPLRSGKKISQSSRSKTRLPRLGDFLLQIIFFSCVRISDGIQPVTVSHDSLPVRGRAGSFLRAPPVGACKF